MPITAIVIFRNEAHRLDRCLSALSWCDELLAVDMASTDDSAAVASRYAHRLFHVERYPIAEPTRVAAARLAKHDWVLLVDPDEEIPATLAQDIRQTLASRPDAGAICLPMWFYFKGERLGGTVWGTLTYKRRLIHRRRCRLLPLCNRLSELLDGYEDVRIEHADDNHMRHYWSDSYRDLLHKHFCRYAHLEAKAMVAQGQRFTWRLGFVEPMRELRKCLKDLDGWRLGVRGWALSAIYFAYVLASCWLTLWYGRGGATVAAQHADEHELPTLVEQSLKRQPQDRRKAA